MRIAICFYGMSPNGHNKKINILEDFTYPTFKKHILNINNNHILDVFVHAWDVKNPDLIDDKYKPIKKIYESNKVFDATSSAFNAFLSHSYSIHQVVSLKTQYEMENNIIYDLVMLMRFDLVWFKDILFDNMDGNYLYLSSNKNLEENKIETHKNLKPYECGIPDLWFISSSHNMNEFSKLYDNISTFIIGMDKRFINVHLIKKLQVQKLGLFDKMKFLLEEYEDVTIQRFLYQHQREDLLAKLTDRKFVFDKIKLSVSATCSRKSAVNVKNILNKSRR